MISVMKKVLHRGDFKKIKAETAGTAEAAEAMDAAERPDNYPTPRSKNGVGPVRPESCGS